VNDTRQPDHSIVIDIRIDDRIITTVQANKNRSDVRAAGFHQTGLCGFNLRFDELLSNEEIKAINCSPPIRANVQSLTASLAVLGTPPPRIRSQTI
jgi:hypothetical protein